MLKLMYITSDPEVAAIAMQSGVDRIFVDMEYIGKGDRQGGMDTVQSKHTVSDVRAIKGVMLPDHELLVRSNPIHSGSMQEIDKIVEAGADIIMLPYFQRAEQVQQFVQFVDRRAKCCLLIESKEAIENLDEILSVEGVDEYYVGLNDLHLDYKMKFMFEPLINGLLDDIVTKLKATGKPYGFGGVARVGEGMLPGERVIIEHYRLGSTCVILSRTFCNSAVITDKQELSSIFKKELTHMRIIESILKHVPCDNQLYSENHSSVTDVVNDIVSRK
ncbi:MAG: aldolase/citrate lyase family protein [Rikenellaceae bacterium]